MKKLAILVFTFLLVVSAVSAATADSVQKSIVVDGDTGEWSGVSSYSMSELSSGSSNPSSSSDLSGSFRTAWDSEYLYFLAEVVDSEYDVTGGNYVYENDGVEIMLDGGNEKSTSYDSNDYKVLVQADGLDMKVWDGSLNDVSGDDVIASGSTTSDGYLIEVGVRWSLIGGQSPSPGAVYGFDFAVNDRDGESYEHQLLWQYVEDHSSDTSGWHELMLSGSSTASSYSFSPSPLDFTDSSMNTLDVSVSDTVIYDIGYYSVDGGNDWSQFSLSGSKAGSWVLSSASSSISLNLADVNASGSEMVAFYACTWKSGWDCHGNNWQIEEFQVTLPEPSDGPVCDNGVLETGEECDGTNFGGETCQSQGFDDGTLGCTSSCTIDTSGCFNDTISDNSSSGSRAGDEAALEALYASAGGSGWTNQQGWSSSGMSLSDDIYGVTTDTVDGELRVTQLDLHDNGLTGSIDIPELGNLKEMELFTVTFNSLNSRVPASLGNATNLKYLYLSRSDPGDQGYKDTYPHVLAFESGGGGDVHVGKNKGSEENIFFGPVPSSLGNLNKLEWFILNWADSAVGATDGISSVPPELFNIDTFVGLQISNNNNIADLPFPEGICNMTNLDNLALNVEKAGRDTGYLTGEVPPCFGNLSNLRFLRLGENTGLIFDFNEVDISGMTNLRNAGGQKVDFRGSFPKEVLDGSMPNLIGFSTSWPSGDGVTGTIPSGSTDWLQIFGVRNNDMHGEIPLDFWDNCKLILLDLSMNNFTSIGTDNLTNMGACGFWRIRNLRWSDNEIRGSWPHLDWTNRKNRERHPLGEFSRFEAANNRYVFRDMLHISDNGRTLFDWYQQEAESLFTYSPQKPFGTPASINANTGEDIVLDNFVGNVSHEDNVYQWQKDGSDISGATSRTLTLNSVDSGDSGTYKLIVDNPNVPGLTLESEPITLNIN